MLSYVSNTLLDTIPSTDWSIYPSTSEALTQTEFQGEDTALHLWVCKKCLGPLADVWTERDCVLVCRKFALVRDLCHQAKELQEDVSRLHNISSDWKDIN